MNKKVFAEKLEFQKLFSIFIIGSIVGCYYEMIYNFFRHLILYGDIFWDIRTGVIYGPFNVIYGFGAMLMAKFLCEKNLKWWKIFLYGAVVGGLCEYILSLLQEIFTGTVSWNYSGYFLNINGRTTIPYMLFWGLLCLLFVEVVYPFISKLLNKIPYRIGSIIFNIMVVFLSIDMFLSFSAVIRQYLRRCNYPPYTFYGEFLDRAYPDEVLKKVYSNMEFVAGE